MFDNFYTQKSEGYVTGILFLENIKNKSKNYDGKEDNIISILQLERKKGGVRGTVGSLT